MNFTEPQTEAERRALEILQNAPLRDDNDYRYLATLINEAVKDLLDKPELEKQE